MIMASSEEKAVALKDAYVKGIVDGAVGSETANAFSALPEQDMGDAASMIKNLDTGVVSAHNDGDPHSYTGRKGTTVRMRDESLRYPFPNQPVGFSTSIQMDRAGHEGASRRFEEAIRLDNIGKSRGWASHPDVTVYQNRQ